MLDNNNSWSMEWVLLSSMHSESLEIVLGSLIKSWTQYFLAVALGLPVPTDNYPF